MLHYSIICLTDYQYLWFSHLSAIINPLYAAAALTLLTHVAKVNVQVIPIYLAIWPNTHRWVNKLR